MQPPLRFTTFFGEMPGVAPHKLPGENAQLARNTRLWSGAIEPLRTFAPLRASSTVGTAQTLFRYNDDLWIESASRLSVVRPAIPNDQHGRVLLFGGDFPRVTDALRMVAGGPPYPGASLRLGVPPPASAPVASLLGSPEDEDDIAETVAYVVTLENSYGEEGPPSRASNLVDMMPGQYARLSLPPIVAGPYDFVAKHIYRSVAGGGFQWIAEVPVATDSYDDDYGSPAFEQLESTDWDPPPEALRGAIALTNGAVAAFRSNELWISEPGLPHAWPYSYPVEHEIVGLAAFGGSVAVITTHRPVIFTGVHPSSMAPTKPAIGYGCVSAESIVDLGYGCIYAAADGLVYLGADGATEALTEPTVFSPEQWHAMEPKQMQGALWKQLYICFGPTTSFVINPRQPQAGIVQVLRPGSLGARHTDEHTGALFIAAEGQIGEWDAGVLEEYVWRSRPTDLPRPGKLKVVQVLADEYPVEVDVIADGELQTSVTVRGERPLRIPPPRQRVRTYAMEVRGKTRVREILGAETMAQLRRV